MTLRNADARLTKMEGRRQRADEFLVVWRAQGADIADALVDAKFAGGDRVVCIEWSGEGPPPAPKWHPNIRADFSPEESASERRALEDLIKAFKVEQIKQAADSRWLGQMTDGELLHNIWGVTL